MHVDDNNLHPLDHFSRSLVTYGHTVKLRKLLANPGKILFHLAFQPTSPGFLIKKKIDPADVDLEL